MKNDWLDLEWHIHNLDVVLEGYERVLDKLKDGDDKRKILDSVLKCTKLKTKIMNMMTKS